MSTLSDMVRGDTIRVSGAGGGNDELQREDDLAMWDDYGAELQRTDPGYFDDIMTRLAAVLSARRGTLRAAVDVTNSH